MSYMPVFEPFDIVILSNLLIERDAWVRAMSSQDWIVSEVLQTAEPPRKHFYLLEPEDGDSPPLIASEEDLISAGRKAPITKYKPDTVLRTGDNVMVLSGKNRSRIGKVCSFLEPTEGETDPILVAFEDGDEDNPTEIFELADLTATGPPQSVSPRYTTVREHQESDGRTFKLLVLDAIARRI